MDQIQSKTMTDKTYRIEELCTTGWEITDDKYQHLNKAEATKALNQLIEDGHNPNQLRAIPDGTTN